MVTDDILLVCGLESQIATSPKVLPSGLSSNQQLNIQLCDLIENFPGTLVVVRSVMERDNVLFSKASSTKTRNVEKLFPQSLKDVGVCDTDAVAEHCRTFDPLRVLLGQKPEGVEYKPTHFKGGRPTPYFAIAAGISALKLNHKTDEDFLRELFPTEYWKAINQMSNDEAFYMRKLLMMLLHSRFGSSSSLNTSFGDNFEVLKHFHYAYNESSIQEFDDSDESSLFYSELVQELFETTLYKEWKNADNDILDDPNNELDNKDSKTPAPDLNDDDKIGNYVFAEIDHVAVNKGLHVHAYCTEQHQHEVDMAFVAALAKRRHATVVAFRENITAPCSPNQGFGYNLYTRAHDFMNASLDARYSVILPSELQEISDVQRLVRVREMLTPPLPSTKPRISLFEYLACAGARLACTRNRGQWRGQGKLDDPHRNYRDTVFPKGINKAVAECEEEPPYELHGTFRQNVIFAGNSPSPHCLKVSMNSLVPLTVETRDENGFSYRVRVDLRPVLQTQLMSLSRTGGQRNSYAEALALHDTPIFRRILLTHNETQPQIVELPVMGPLGENYNENDDHGEYKHLNAGTSQHRKIVDIGCIVDLERPHSGKDFKWPVNVRANFFQNEYGSHWTNPLPIETSLRDLDSYRVFAPEFIDFAHMGSAEVHMRLPGLEKLVNTPIGHVHGNLIDDHSTLITPLLQDRLDDRQPLRAHFVDFNLEGRHESWKLHFLTKYMPKEHHIDYSREKFLTRIPFDVRADHANYMLNKKGQPEQPLYTKVEDLAPFDPLDDLLILMVDIGETFKWTDCSLACAIQARHLVVIAFGTLPIDSSPTTEQLFLAFPRANYICNLTHLSRHFTRKEQVKQANRINAETQALNNHMARLVSTYDSDDTETDDSDLDDLDALM